jgi:hypothetical protein
MRDKKQDKHSRYKIIMVSTQKKNQIHEERSHGMN